MTDDKFYEELSNLINGAFDDTFGRKITTPKVRRPIMQTQPEPAPLEEQPQTPVYMSINEYVVKTGKRFRMTKDQKSRRLSRTQAFNETHGGTK
jgi:hypothetical protein